MCAAFIGTKYQCLHYCISRLLSRSVSRYALLIICCSATYERVNGRARAARPARSACESRQDSLFQLHNFSRPFEWGIIFIRNALLRPDTKIRFISLPGTFARNIRLATNSIRLRNECVNNVLPTFVLCILLSNYITHDNESNWVENVRKIAELNG